MSDTVQSAENPRSFNRLHPRQHVSSSCIQLTNDNGGKVLNISESGLSVQAVRSLTDVPVLQMRFQLSRSQAWIETQGRVVWVSESGRTAGVEFVDLPNAARRRIKNWISLTLQGESLKGSEVSGRAGRVATGVLAPSEPVGGGPGQSHEAMGPIVANPSLHRAVEDPVELIPMSEGKNPKTAIRHNEVSGIGRAGAGSYNVSGLLSGSSFQGTRGECRIRNDRRRTARALATVAVCALILGIAAGVVAFPGYNGGNGRLLVHLKERILNQLRQRLESGAVESTSDSSLQSTSFGKNKPPLESPVSPSSSESGVERSSSDLHKPELHRANAQESTTITDPVSEKEGMDSAEPQPTEVSYSKSEDKGEAELVAALKYLHKVSVPGYGNKAVQLLWSSIEKGNKEAELRLADLYVRGEVVSKNCEQARILIRAARKLGVSEGNSLPKNECE